MIAASDMTADELAALLLFHADAGVEWLLDDDPVDRFAAFAARAPAAPPVAQDRETERTERQRPSPAEARAGMADRQPPARQGAGVAMPDVSVPDAQAVAAAVSLAAAATSLPDLRRAIEQFSGCNLRNSARSVVFAEGDPAAGIMIIGPMPSADDDREGLPFSGRHGQLLDRMLGAIGLDRASVLLTHAIPWRPPGNRTPYAHEADMCRPFIERQIVLAAPRHILVLGNFTARFLFGGAGTIHDLRGEWRDIVAGGMTIPAMATWHPQDLIASPASKQGAWRDLLTFRARLSR